MAMTEQRVGVRRAADYLGVSPFTLYRWAGQRRLTTVKLGGRLLFDLRDLERFVERNKRPAREARR